MKKFITCMIFGILASKTVLLSDISRSLNERILLKKTIERLSRNLEKFCYKDKLLSNLSHEVKGYIHDDTPIIIDLSDVVKSMVSFLKIWAKSGMAAPNRTIWTDIF